MSQETTKQNKKPQVFVLALIVLAAGDSKNTEKISLKGKEQAEV